jgi:3-isopropylmalate dehydrogenase
VVSGQILLDGRGRKHDDAQARQAAALIGKALGTVMREKRSLTADTR